MEGFPTWHVWQMGSQDRMNSILVEELEVSIGVLLAVKEEIVKNAVPACMAERVEEVLRFTTVNVKLVDDGIVVLDILMILLAREQE